MNIKIGTINFMGVRNIAFAATLVWIAGVVAA